MPNPWLGLLGDQAVYHTDVNFRGAVPLECRYYSLYLIIYSLFGAWQNTVLQLYCAM